MDFCKRPDFSHTKEPVPGNLSSSKVFTRQLDIDLDV